MYAYLCIYLSIKVTVDAREALFSAWEKVISIRDEKVGQATYGKDCAHEQAVSSLSYGCSKTLRARRCLFFSFPLFSFPFLSFRYFFL